MENRSYSRNSATTSAEADTGTPRSRRSRSASARSATGSAYEYIRQTATASAPWSRATAATEAATASSSSLRPAAGTSTPSRIPGSASGAGSVGERVVQRGAVLAGDLDQRLETGVGHQQRPGPPTLQQSVGGHGGAVEQVGPGTRPHRSAGPGHHPLALVVGGGRDLPDGHGRTVPHGDVGERPAHVDPHSHPSGPAHVDPHSHPIGPAYVVALGHGAGVSVLRSVMGLVCPCCARSWGWCVRVALGHGAGVSVLRSVMGLVCSCCARSWGWCVRVALGHGAGVSVLPRRWRPCRCGQRNLLRRAGGRSRGACRGRRGP